MKAILLGKLQNVIPSPLFSDVQDKVLQKLDLH
jgi:hypothetical protein